MDKTLGQIAMEAHESSPHYRAHDRHWEHTAAAVAAAVKEEDARICDAMYFETYPDAEEWERSAEGAAIRASIKEAK